MQELLRNQEEWEKNDFQLFACRIFNESFSRFGPSRHITIIYFSSGGKHRFFFLIMKLQHFWHKNKNVDRKCFLLYIFE